MRTLNLFDLYAKISLDSTDYEKAVKDATKDSGGLISRFQEIAKTSETTGNKIKVLANQYSAAQAEVDRLTDAFNKSAKENGVASKETQKLAQELQNAENRAAGLKSQLDQMTNSAKNSGSMFDKLKNGISTFGKVAAVGIGAITAAAGAAVSGLLALEQSTEEYRQAMGRLNTAFKTAGYGADTAQEAYTAFYGILGDTGTATEASQLLAQLADSAEDVSVWTDIAAGVNGTFGDSLPIEGLIEAANETANVGTVTGVLADALNWVGISEDEFNEKLAACSSESERNQLIMETLAGQYDEASDAFYRNNEALVASRNAQAQMDAVLAQLGQTVSTVKNNLISEFLPAISNVATAFNGMLTGAEGADEQFSSAIQELVNQVAEKLPEFLDMGVQILSSLASGIVSAIPTVVAAIPQVVSSIGSALAELFPQVLDMGVQLLDQLTTGIETGLPDMLSRIPEIIVQFLEYITSQLPTILDKGVELLNSMVDGILDAIPDMVAQLPQVITAFINFIADSLPDIVQAGIDILLNLLQGILDTIPELVANLPQIIKAIVNGIGALMGSIVEIGANIVRGIWQGIQSMVSWITDKVTGFFSGIVNGVKSFLGINSPSRVFAEVGENMALGLGQGWDSEYDRIRRDIESGMNFGTASVDFASSGLGRSQSGLSGALNSMAATMGQNFTITVQSVLDGKVIGETAYQYSRNKQRAYGM